jgi:hypothetical protein
MVAGTHLSVTVYAHYLSCLNLTVFGHKDVLYYCGHTVKVTVGKWIWCTQVFGGDKYSFKVVVGSKLPE